VFLVVQRTHGNRFPRASLAFERRPSRREIHAGKAFSRARIRPQACTRPRRLPQIGATDGALDLLQPVAQIGNFAGKSGLRRGMASLGASQRVSLYLSQTSQLGGPSAVACPAPWQFWKAWKA
jgi:hypothetical protein